MKERGMAVKNKLRLSCLLLGAVMLFSLAACGKKGGDTTDPKESGGDSEFSTELKSPKTMTTSLWELVYDEADGWVYKEDNFKNTDTYSKITLTIPKEGSEEENLISAKVEVSLDEPYNFRDYLTSFGFDEYKYAQEQAYELTEVGGVDCLKSEESSWGSPCLRYFNRVEGAGATVMVELIGDYENARVDKLLSGLTIQLEDVGHEDGPWYWEGEPFTAEPASGKVGSFTINSQWIPFQESLVTKETFQHSVVAVGNRVYMLVAGAFKQFDFDGKTLTLAQDIPLDEEYEDLSVDNSGNIWLANFMAPMISWKDGAQTGAYDGPDQAVMHPSGTWGISWFASSECERLTLSGGTMTSEPMEFEEVEVVGRIIIDEDYIYVCGSDAGTGEHHVFLYDTDGNFQMALCDEEGGGLGSISFITQTDNGFMALDANMREVVFWSKDGTYIGALEDRDLFGTGYPWLCGGTKLEDGSVLVVLTETREDKSADEVIAFRLSGF